MNVGYSYIRFSSSKQAAGSSLERQLERTEQYCKANNIILDQSLTLRDLGVSAKDGANVTDGALGSFLELCKQGRINEPAL